MLQPYNQPTQWFPRENETNGYSGFNGQGASMLSCCHVQLYQSEQYVHAYFLKGGDLGDYKSVY